MTDFCQKQQLHLTMIIQTAVLLLVDLQFHAGEAVHQGAAEPP